MLRMRNFIANCLFNIVCPEHDISSSSSSSVLCALQSLFESLLKVELKEVSLPGTVKNLLTAFQRVFFYQISMLLFVQKNLFILFYFQLRYVLLGIAHVFG